MGSCSHRVLFRCCRQVECKGIVKATAGASWRNWTTSRGKQLEKPAGTGATNNGKQMEQPTAAGANSKSKQLEQPAGTGTTGKGKQQLLLLAFSYGLLQSLLVVLAVFTGCSSSRWVLPSVCLRETSSFCCLALHFSVESLLRQTGMFILFPENVALGLSTTNWDLRMFVNGVRSVE